MLPKHELLKILLIALLSLPDPNSLDAATRQCPKDNDGEVKSDQTKMKISQKV